MFEANAEAPAPAPALSEGYIRTGLAGRGGCSIEPAGSKGPLDPLLALLAAIAALSLRLRQGFRRR